MVVTHLFQILAFMAMEPPTSLEPKPISEEKHKVFRSMLPIESADVVRGQYLGYHGRRRRARIGHETFIALKCSIDNWRWAGVPFYLRTGKCMAEGSASSRSRSASRRRACSRRLRRRRAGAGSLTFDLADLSKVSLSFYGKRPGPGMRLDKLSLQFAMHDTVMVDEVLEAYERLILDAMRGDHTLFTKAEGIERLWRSRRRCSNRRRRFAFYATGSWARTRSISSSHRTRGGCRSRGRGAIRIPRAADRPVVRARLFECHAPANQFSTRRPETRLNSRSLLVTSVRFAARA